MAANNCKVVIIGLDGATPQLLWPWIKAGKLPALERLVSKGVHSELRSTIPPLSPSAWSSFATGKNPGKHGIYDHVRRRPGHYELEPVNAAQQQGPTLWEMLSDQKVTVGIINVPVTYPPKTVNGYLISGMYTPSKQVNYTFPAALAQELTNVNGGYALFADHKKHDDFDGILTALHQARQSRMQAVTYLRKTIPTDFFIFVFDETDRAQHRFWKFMDTQHPRHEPAGPAPYKDVLLNLYQDIDRDIADIVNHCDDNTIIIVMSDHGFGPLYKYVYLNNWLLEQGYLRLKPDLTTQLKYQIYKFGLTPARALNLGAKLGLGLPAQAVAQAKQARKKSGKGFYRRLLLSASNIDWPASIAYAMGGNLAGIYLNVSGREPQGAVAPGQQYKQLREEIKERLKDIHDPDTNEQIFPEVYSREEVYSGPSLEQAPDIVFMTNQDRYVAQGSQEYMFSSNKIMDIPLWPPDSGTHHRDGILIMAGKPLQPNQYIPPAEIIDITPTVLYLMGLPIPTDIDGKVITSALEADYMARHPIQFTEPGKESLPNAGQASMTNEEKAAIAKRLKDLGYLG